MFSVIILICNMSQTQCMTFAPQSVYKTEELCEVTAEANIPTMMESLPEDTQVTYKCVNWGTST